MSPTIGIITCPSCGHQASEPVPDAACLRFFDCPGCSARLEPRAGDCCVFCSFGDRPCPSRGEASPPPA